MLVFYKESHRDVRYHPICSRYLYIILVHNIGIDIGVAGWGVDDIHEVW